MKSRAQLEASVERFHRCFWDREATDRPPIGVVPSRAWLPIEYLRAPLGRDEVTPADPLEKTARTDYEACFAARPVESDDFMPYSAAWRAIPWLEAICGCRVRASAGSLAPGRFVAAAVDLDRLPIPASQAWFNALRRETQRLAETVPADCWVSPSIFRGTSDVLAAVRGLDDFLLDLYDDPQAVKRAAARINRLHLAVLDQHFSLVRPKLGGYGHIFGYWAPGPTTVIQEDAMGLCAPAVYRDFFMELNAEIVRRLGPHVLFHLHSTGYRHYRDVLRIPGLAGLEITIEANGPNLTDMLPALREILERTRLVLMIDGYFDQLPEVFRRLPHDGLYLLVSGNCVRSEAEFEELRLRLS